MSWKSYYNGEPENDDERYMLMAIEEAQKCQAQKKFGAVVVYGNRVIARAHSTVLEDSDPTQHAELKVVGSTARAVSNDRSVLSSCILYTTCEPCTMCTGAILWAYIGTVVYGMERKESMHNFWESQPWHEVILWTVSAHPKHCITIRGGVLREECARLMPPPDGSVVGNKGFFGDPYEYYN